MKIIFENPTIQRTISGEYHEEIFKGHVVGQPVTITNVKPSCGCVTVDYPKDTLISAFSIKAIIKLGTTGFYSKNIKVGFSNGEVHTLNINGKAQ